MRLWPNIRNNAAFALFLKGSNCGNKFAEVAARRFVQVPYPPLITTVQSRP